MFLGFLQHTLVDILEGNFLNFDTVLFAISSYRFGGIDILIEYETIRVLFDSIQLDFIN